MGRVIGKLEPASSCNTVTISDTGKHCFQARCLPIIDFTVYVVGWGMCHQSQTPSCNLTLAKMLSGKVSVVTNLVKTEGNKLVFSSCPTQKTD